jgi:aminotransferase
MNDIAASLGLSQLERLLEFVAYRADLVALYNDLLPDEFQVKVDLGHTEDSYYFYWIQTPRRDELARYLRANNIYTSFRYYPLHLAYKTGDSLPNAEQAARETLLLPLHCNLTDEDVEYICGKVREFLNDR